MKNAILVHGWARKKEFYDQKYPTISNSHWFPWLSKQLMINDIFTVAVEMPKSYYPQYDIWKHEFERYDIGPDTILVGHSCGGGFLVRWLSENPRVSVGKVVLVAPWMGISPDQDFDATFFDFDIDPTISSRTDGLVLFNSTDDVPAIQESVALLKEKLANVTIREFTDKKHFTLKHMGTDAFPELLEELV